MYFISLSFDGNHMKYLTSYLLLETSGCLTLQRRNQIPPGKAACRDFLLGILIFKGLTARRLYTSFGVKGLRLVFVCHHYDLDDKKTHFNGPLPL
jgi:hypothetical protein